jgi:ribosomal protein S18 acetylase RimI-like enzyme
MNGTQTRQAGGRAAAAIRPLGPTDLAALNDFFTGLSAETRYRRFFGPVAPTPDLLRLLSGGVALVAVRAGVIVGHAMAADRTDSTGARTTDIGVVVADAWQGRGLGSALVRALLAGAQARGVTFVVMDVLHANQRVLAMIRGHWPEAGFDVSRDCVTARIPLPGPAAGHLRGDSIRDHDHSRRRRRDGVLVT